MDGVDPQMWSISQFDLVTLLRCSFVIVAATVSFRPLLPVGQANSCCACLSVLTIHQIAVAKHVPLLSGRFFAYGARAVSTVTPASTDAKKHTDDEKKRTATSFLDSLAGITVPHGYFTHFYIVSVASSLFWAIQILLQGRIITYLCSFIDHDDPERTAVGAEKVLLCWSVMAVQGLRRLWECTVFKRPPSSPSKSRMWFGHWLLGIWFYISVNIAIWIEGDIGWFSCYFLQHEERMGLEECKHTRFDFPMIFSP